MTKAVIDVKLWLSAHLNLRRMAGEYDRLKTQLEASGLPVPSEAVFRFLYYVHLPRLAYIVNNFSGGAWVPSITADIENLASYFSQQFQLKYLAVEIKNQLYRDYVAAIGGRTNLPRDELLAALSDALAKTLSASHHELQTSGGKLLLEQICWSLTDRISYMIYDELLNYLEAAYAIRRNLIVVGETTERRLLS